MESGLPAAVGTKGWGQGSGESRESVCLCPPPVFCVQQPFSILSPGFDADAAAGGEYLWPEKINKTQEWEGETKWCWLTEYYTTQVCDYVAPFRALVAIW